MGLAKISVGRGVVQQALGEKHTTWSWLFNFPKTEIFKVIAKKTGEHYTKSEY